MQHQRREPSAMSGEVHHYTIKCYRQVPGDAECHDLPAFTESLDDAVELAGDMLLAYRNSPLRKFAQRPYLAHLEDERGRVAARIRAVSSTATERIDESVTN
jgi:hypothetical protein